MRRRDFVFTALSGAGLLAASGLLDRNSAYAALLREIKTAPVLTRRNVYCLPANSREIRAYKDAIVAMKALPNTNGTSWEAQANIHGAFSAPPGMIANVCRHDITFFLAWHRMYVYYFERIARHKSGFHNFALPFWGYSPTGMRDLPKVFRDPADAATNPLFTSNRNSAINGGALINPSTVDAGTALAQMTFNSFTSVLNGTPHGGVHIAVGGGMSSFQGAGRDPIFWLHHCNIDRLWEVWLSQGGGRANPTDPTWLTTAWSFYDETGATVSLTGAQIVDTAYQLSYRYESDICGRLHADERGWWRRYTAVIEPPPGQAQRMLDMERGRSAGRGGRSQAAQAPQTIAELTQPSRLGASVVRVTLPISAQGRTLLAQLSRDTTALGRLTLSLDDVRVEGTPRVAYEMYIDLPANETPVYTGPHYAGSVNLFGPAPVQGQPQRLDPQSVPLSLIFLRLTSTNRWLPDSVTVTFVPRAVLEGQDPARVLGQATQATIQRISVRIQ